MMRRKSRGRSQWVLFLGFLVFVMILLNPFGSHSGYESSSQVEQPPSAEPVVATRAPVQTPTPTAKPAATLTAAPRSDTANSPTRIPEPAASTQTPRSPTPRPTPPPSEPTPVPTLDPAPTPKPSTLQPTTAMPVLLKRESPPLVIANYYHQYGHKKLAWTGKGAQRRTEDPLMGLYDSVDRRVLDQHIEWAVAHGITALCVVVDETKLLEGKQQLFSEISASRSLHKIKVMLRLHTTKTTDTAVAGIKRFFNESWYLRIEGKPALSTAGVKDPVAKKLRKALGGKSSVFLIGHDEAPLDDDGRLVDAQTERQFDAITIDSATLFKKVNIAQTVLATMKDRGVFEMYEELLANSASHGRFIPTLISRLNTAGAVQHSTPDQFREQIRRIVGAVAATTKKTKLTTVLFVDSFNNYIDGSEVEPTERFGFQYLDAMREELAPWLPAVTDGSLHQTRRHWAVNSHYRHLLINEGRVTATESGHVNAPIEDIRDSLTGDAGSIDKSKQHPLVMGYYYMWYNNDFWHLMRRREDPLIGLYESLDPNVIEQHIEWAVDHGIESFVVSFDHTNYESIHKMLSSVSNINKMKIILHYETLGAQIGDSALSTKFLEWDNERNAVYVLSLLRRVSDLFFKEPWYLHIEGRPAMVFYVTRTWKGTSHITVNRMRAAMGNFFSIGDQIFWGKDPEEQIALGKSYLDSYTSYNMYESLSWWRNPHEHFFDPAGEEVNAHLRATATVGKYEQWAKLTQFVPHILPQYYDFRPLHPPLFGSADEFRQNIEMAKGLGQPPMEGEYSSLFFVVSFNEWFEGTSVEPTEQWGFQQLEVIRTQLAPHRPKPTYNLDEIRSDAKFKLYRTRLVDTPFGGRGRVTRGESAFRGDHLPISNLGSELRPLALFDYVISHGRSPTAWADFAKRTDAEAPLMGHYTSTDVRVLNQHVDWAAWHGIGAFNARIATPTDIDALHSLLQRGKGLLDTRLFFTASIAPAAFGGNSSSSDDFGIDGGSDAKATAALQRIADQLFSSVYWLHIDETPVLMLKAGASTLSSRLLQILKTGLGKAYLVLETDAPPKITDEMLDVFDAFTSTSGIKESQINDWNGVAVAHGIRWIPRVRNRAKDTSGSTEAWLKTNIAIYKNIPQKALTNYSRLVIYSSFNDFEESTGLEPTQERGFQLLEWFREEHSPYRIRWEGSPANDTKHWAQVSPYHHRLEASRKKTPMDKTPRLRKSKASKNEIILFAYFRLQTPENQREILSGTPSLDELTKAEMPAVTKQLKFILEESPVNTVVIDVHELGVVQGWTFMYRNSVSFCDELRMAYQVDLARLDPNFNATNPTLSIPAIITLKTMAESFNERAHMMLRFDDAPVVLYRARNGPVNHAMMSELRTFLGEHVAIGDVGADPAERELVVDGLSVFDVYTTFSWVEDAISKGAKIPTDNFDNDMHTFLDRSGAYDKMRKWAETPEIAYMPSISPSFAFRDSAKKVKRFPDLSSSVASFRTQAKRVKKLAKSPKYPGGVAGMYFLDSFNDHLHGTVLKEEWHSVLNQTIPTKWRKERK